MSGNLVSHIGICVTDLDLAVQFYSSVFGFQQTSRTLLDDEIDALLGVKDSSLEVCLLALGDRPATRIELIHFKKPPPGSREERPMNTIGFTHLAIYVDNIDETCRKVSEQGGIILEGRAIVLRDGESSRRYQMVRDLFGTLIELIQAPVLG